jgi:hypothetical protein
VPVLSSSFHLRLCLPYTLFAWSSPVFLVSPVNAMWRPEFITCPRAKAFTATGRLLSNECQPLFLPPTRCHCSRIRSIQLWNSRPYYADFSISEAIPEGSATGRFSTTITRRNFCYFHNTKPGNILTSWISHVRMSGALSSKLCCVKSPLRSQHALYTIHRFMPRRYPEARETFS